nr:hypothetical protein [uncultured Sphingomonas sp.]
MRVVPALMHDHVMPVATRRWASGIASLDTALAGGMAYGCLHELYSLDTEDVAAAAGFAMAVTTAMMMEGGNGRRTILWLRPSHAARLGGAIQAQGWAELGGVPGDGLVANAPDTLALLRAAVDALRCSMLGAVVMEGWGTMRELDLTASRRLSLAAEASGTPLFLLRIDAAPSPSAAQTRWQVGAAPSAALPGNAPGRPTFDINLLRQRSGPCGLNWRLEWDRDQHMFRDTAIPGIVVPVPVRRSFADRGTGPLHQDDRRAA